MNIDLNSSEAQAQLISAYGEEIIPFLAFLLKAWLKRQRITVAELPVKWQKFDDESLVSNKLIRRYNPNDKGTDGANCVKIWRDRKLTKLIKKASVAKPTEETIVENLAESLVGLLEVVEATVETEKESDAPVENPALQLVEMLAVGEC